MGDYEYMRCLTSKQGIVPCLKKQKTGHLAFVYCGAFAVVLLQITQETTEVSLPVLTLVKFSMKSIGPTSWNKTPQGIRQSPMLTNCLKIS